MTKTETRKEHHRGNTTIIYVTDKSPGFTKMNVTWDNPVKREKYRERVAAKGRHEQARKAKAEAARIRKLKYSSSAIKRTKKRK